MHKEENLMHAPLWFTIIGFHTLVVFLLVAASLLYLFPQRLHHVFAVFIGLLVAFVDQEVSEPQLPALLLLAFGFFLGAMQPARPWRWALLISIWVPLGGLLRIVIETRTDALVRDGAPAIIALIPAFVAAYAGKFIATSPRKVVSPP
jgi:hypothetical protein